MCRVRLDSHAVTLEDGMAGLDKKVAGKSIGEMRKEWKLAKKALAECGVDVKGVADKPGFGPALDVFEKAYDAWENYGGSDAKGDKLEASMEAAAKKAADKGGAYMKVLVMAQKHLKKEASTDPKEKVKLAGVEMGLEKIHDIYKRLMPFYK